MGAEGGQPARAVKDEQCMCSMCDIAGDLGEVGVRRRSGDKGQPPYRLARIVKTDGQCHPAPRPALGQWHHLRHATKAAVTSRGRLT